MTFNTVEEVIAEIQKYQKTPSWVITARKKHVYLNALVTGKDFNKVLITQFEKLESSDRAIARDKYSKDIRDLVARIKEAVINVFTASGGTNKNDIANKVHRERFDEAMTNFKGQKSIKHYLSENYFQLLDVDPNGLIFVEYRGEEDIYPTYKSINDIRYYKSNGQLTEVVIFEPTDEMTSSNTPFKEWRVVDDKKDWRIKQVGLDFTEIEEKTFEHPFGMPPAIILSEKEIIGEEVRVPTINDITNLLEFYAIDSSIQTIYKKQNGFPITYRYVQTCRNCKGTGKTGAGDNEKACSRCDGGAKSKDVTDIIEIETPRDKDDPVLANDLAGFISPDLATITMHDEQMTKFEDRADATYWGTRRVAEGTNETATGRFIDVQPVINKLSYLSNRVEWVHNQLGYFVENYINGGPVEKTAIQFTYGKRFIIESADTILDKYNEAVKAGSNVTILDKLLDEYLLAKYQNNLTNLTVAQNKRKVEPYVHNSEQDVFDRYGADESYKKVIFPKWWNIVDHSKDLMQLQSDWDAYVVANPKPEDKTVSN
ncbi:MAG: hypothetical protein COA36_16685 [Desulfotalea sp.]|nr:MAG: hypothetical protein COA36_16685 [Desulfotalea sp.]